ncbi:kinesin-like protein Nod [Drosophila guanche]|uniref:Blast:Kinesin-like protein Nod n=1 Tax=Drosophila guanche TaxID=7266 RepID=A0A3B0KEX0_DROGU|nr:kinesin-like protein Nod [Drosophila guanche]SPP86870.1 blast:Kinesin-like protein Nod [Drosophila guanche]
MDCDKLSAVRVGVREAPFRSFLGRQEPSIVHFSPQAGNSLVVDQNDYHFDYAFRSTVSQLELYGALIMPLVDKLFCGFECTVMAYGQTGTGKSYSMGMTADNQATSEEHLGVLPRCLRDILDRVAAKQENTLERIQVSASFIEIYNEKAYDLLGATPMDPMLASRCNSCTCLPLASQEDLQRLLQLGNNNRHVRRTNMNANSSRSHAIVTIHMRRQGGQLFRMNIVDLAGSEGVRRTGHEGVARQEGVSINMGLLSINKVVMAMAAGHTVIPYRDSVLTTVLQKSLTSQSYLTFLACISPHACDLSETISTLRFAKSAKRLRLNPQQMIMSRNHQLQQQQQQQQQRQTLAARTPHALRRPFTSSTTVKVSRPTQRDAQNSFYLMPPKPKESMPLMQLQRTRSEMGLTPKAKKRAREELQMETTMDAPSDSNHSAISLVEKGCSAAVSLSNSETESTLVEPLSGSNVTLKQEQEQDSNGTMGPPQPPPAIPLFHSSLLSIAEEPYSQQQKLQQRQLLFDNTCSPIVLPAAGPLEMSGIQPLDISQRPVLRARRSARLIFNSNRQQSSTEQQQQQQQNQNGLRRSMRLAVKLESHAVTANQLLASQDSGSVGASRKRSKAAAKRWMNNQKDTFLNLLNSADVRELQKLPGIGPKTAFSLALQRGRLGGFQSLSQVQELPIWGLVKWERVCGANGLDP